MKLSELIDVLNKAKQFLVTAGEDADVLLHAAESDAETVIHSLDLHLTGTSSGTAPAVTLTHGTPPPAPPPPDPPPLSPPADTPTTG